LESRDEREQAFKSIVLSGGNTMLHGFNERLEYELCNKLEIPYPQEQKENPSIKIYADPQRRHAVWLGASIVSSHSSFQTKWFSKEQYDEFGPSGSVFHCDLELDK